jgi:hypothetical protein
MEEDKGLQMHRILDIGNRGTLHFPLRVGVWEKVNPSASVAESKLTIPLFVNAVRTDGGNNTWTDEESSMNLRQANALHTELQTIEDATERIESLWSDPELRDKHHTQSLLHSLYSACVAMVNLKVCIAFMPKSDVGVLVESLNRIADMTQDVILKAGNYIEECVPEDWVPDYEDDDDVPDNEDDDDDDSAGEHNRRFMLN